MLILTTDIHHKSLNTVDQNFLQESELNIFARFLQILPQVRLNAFISGRAVEEETMLFGEVAKDPRVIFGGHNYSCFQPLALYQVMDKVLNMRNGTYRMQLNDISRTKNIIQAHTEYAVDTWRNHGYRRDENTRNALVQSGIKYWSDLVSIGAQPRYIGDIYEIPINTPPDHDHIYHGDVIESYALRKRKITNPLRPHTVRGMTYSSWRDNLMQSVLDNKSEGKVSVVLFHVCCASAMSKERDYVDLVNELITVDSDVRFLKDIENNEKNSK